MNELSAQRDQRAPLPLPPSEDTAGRGQTVIGKGLHQSLTKMAP